MEEVIELTIPQRHRLAKLIMNKKNMFLKYLLYTLPSSIIIDICMIEIFQDNVKVEGIKVVLCIIIYVTVLLTQRFMLNSNIYSGFKVNIFDNDKIMKCTLINTESIEIIEKNKKQIFKENREIKYKLRGKEEVAADVIRNTIDEMQHGENRLAVIEFGIYRWEVALSLIDIDLMHHYIMR